MMNQKSRVLCILLLLTFFLTINAKLKRIIRSGRRIHRHVPQYPRRQERTRLDCRAHENYVRCGPEPHCEMSCDNLYSPPHCYHAKNHPKCYYPRCICSKGFIRNRIGFCVREWKCPQRYFEYGLYNGDDNDLDNNNHISNYENTIKYQYGGYRPKPRKHFW